MTILPRCLRLGAALSLLTVALVAQTAAPSDTAAVDRAVSEEVAERFGGDRAAFLQHLRKQGKTLREYRADVAARLEPGRPEAEVRVRLIELKRHEGETDAALRARAERTVLARLQAGEAFADLAREVSEARASASKGGDQGWLKRDDQNAPFAAAVFALAPGKTTAPLLTPAGCYVFFVEERR
ncbi:MAG TPA: peptidylprolyl isomerase [Opitutaceae bacterium]